MSQFSIFYGPQGGSVDRVSKQLSSKLSAISPVQAKLVKDVATEEIITSDLVVFGISTVGRDTWDMEMSNNDWSTFMVSLREMDLTGKKIAIYGLGDHITYASNFVDAIGELAQVVEAAGAKIVGKVSPEGYTFDDSKALRDGLFLGLPLDEDFESEMTEGRLTSWVAQLQTEI